MHNISQRNRFINISIKWRFPRHSIVHIINSKDEYFGSQCKVIGWTASRVIITTTETGVRLTRVPKNLTKPRGFAE